eukprot:2195908-Amphidinium_carterae.1
MAPLIDFVRCLKPLHDAVVLLCRLSQTNRLNPSAHNTAAVCLCRCQCPVVAMIDILVSLNTQRGVGSFECATLSED